MEYCVYGFRVMVSEKKLLEEVMNCIEWLNREELRSMFSKFSEVKLTDKIYIFHDESGKEDRIDAVLVEAQK